MMTRMSAVGPERLTSGLSSVIRESGKSGRDKLLGISPPLSTSPSPLSFDPSPDCELREEDVWGAGDDEDHPEEQQQQHPQPKIFKRHWLLGLESGKTEASPLGITSMNTRKPMMIPAVAAAAAGFESGPRHPQSAPVNIPDWSKILGRGSGNNKENGFGGLESEEEESEIEGGEKLPPHELIAREYAKRHTAFSVYEGAGRTLKGMDLSRVRNAVWKQTGFIGG